MSNQDKLKVKVSLPWSQLKMYQRYLLMHIVKFWQEPFQSTLTINQVFNGEHFVPEKVLKGPCKAYVNILHPGFLRTNLIHQGCGLSAPECASYVAGITFFPPGSSYVQVFNIDKIMSF